MPIAHRQDKAQSYLFLASLDGGQGQGHLTYPVEPISLQEDGRIARRAPRSEVPRGPAPRQLPCAGFCRFPE